MAFILGVPSYVIALRVVILFFFFSFASTINAWLFLIFLIGGAFPGLHLRDVVYAHRAEILVLAAAAWIASLAYSSYARRTSRVVDLSTWDGPGRPLLFPCKTTHTRFFPKKHSFEYSYLLVGIPIGWTGTAGGMISNDGNGTGVKGWYNVNAADYLERGDGHIGLRGKLDAYLKSQVCQSFL